MDSKHTPGPWKFGETPSLDGQGIAFEVDTDDFTIAHVYPTFDSGNAALIAAAPDMYEALKVARAQAEAFCDTCDRPNPDTADEPCEDCPLRILDGVAFAALAKAKGR